jgi:SNF2 family DNA or RNA helicase
MFDFLWPDSNPIDSEAKIRLQIYQDNDNYQLAKDILKETTGPLFYRVRKSELGLIPPAFHPPCVLPMNSYEKMIYNAIENRIRDKALSNQDYLEDINLIWRLRRGRIIRLRQCVSNVKLLSTAIEDYEEDLIEDESGLRQIIIAYDTLEIPRKLEYLCELVGKLQEENKKVVIWAHFVRTLELIKKHLSEAGFACKLIYGQTPIEQISIHEEETREKIRNEFVDPKSGLDILVANPAACGESISLHKTCHHAIYYDLSYNCAQYLQSLDRIHRVGGSEIKQANYHFLQYENTIDQDIMNNLNKKAEKMYDIVEEDYSIYSLDMFEEDNDVAAYNRLFGEN